MMWFIFKCSYLGLVPPPELAEHFARASLSNPDSTYAAALFQTGWFVELIAHANSDYPRDPDKQSAFHPKPRQLAAHRDLRGDHASRDVVAVFTDRSVAGVCSFAAPLWPLLLITLLLYVVLTQVVKMWLVRKLWI